MKNTRSIRRVGAAVVGAAALLCAASGISSGSTLPGTSPSKAASSEPIRVGAIEPLTGQFAASGTEGYGAQAYWDYVNVHGGINGHPVKFYLGNDQYNPALTPGVAAQLVGQDHVQLMCAGAGADDNAAIKPYLAAHHVPDVPAAATPTLLTPLTPTEYQVVPEYNLMAADVVKYAVDVLHDKKIAIAYTDDDVGLPALAGVKWETSQLHVPLVAKVVISNTATSDASQAARLKASGADFVVAWGIDSVDALLVNTAVQIGYHTTWSGPFWTADSTYTQLTHDATSERMYFPTPFNTTNAAASASYRAAIRKYEPKIPVSNVNAIQGWSISAACGALLQAATAGGHQLTFSRLVQAATHLDVNNTYVHGLRWTTTEHNGLSKAAMLKQEGSSYVQITGYEPMPQAPIQG